MSSEFLTSKFMHDKIFQMGALLLSAEFLAVKGEIIDNLIIYVNI